MSGARAPRQHQHSPMRRSRCRISRSTRVSYQHRFGGTRRGLCAGAVVARHSVARSQDPAVLPQRPPARHLALSVLSFRGAGRPSISIESHMSDCRWFAIGSLMRRVLQQATQAGMFTHVLSARGRRSTAATFPTIAPLSVALSWPIAPSRSDICFHASFCKRPVGKAHAAYPFRLRCFSAGGSLRKRSRQKPADSEESKR